MTKIDIISGFLGAGKTTLIKKLLAEAFAGEKLVLIENEFGEIGIDGGFLKESGVQITEMNSGCICCSLVGDFGKALGEVLEKYAPDRIIIEPSGVGKLSDVIKAVEGVKSSVEIKLNSFTAVVDAKKSKMYMKNFGEFFNNQVEYAGTIILSRTQDMKQEKLEECVKQLREHNSAATIITTPWDEIKGEQILAAMEKNNTLEKELLAEHEEHEHHHEHGEHDHDHGEGCTCGCHDHDHHHHADEVFASWGVETAHKFTEEELTAALEELSETDRHGMILRAKGIVPAVTGEWLHFDLTPGEYEIRKGAADVTGRICVIGSKLKEDEIAALFLA